MNCLICQNTTDVYTSAVVLNKYNVTYYCCPNCDFIQTESPYWLVEAYKESINKTDTGILKRNSYLARVTSTLIYFFFDRKKKFLDFAGGYGILTRHMRDYGFDFYWKDKYSDNLFAKGFEFNNIDNVELLTSFEVFEHFVDPMKEIELMLKYSRNILFSTFLLPKRKPLPEEWWYFGLEHGQHISIYSYKTLKYIANKKNLNLYSNGKNVHLLTEKKISLLLFKILVFLSYFGITEFIKLFFNTKIKSDMDFLIEQEKTNENK